MTTRQVLSVGQCDYDHGQIQRFLQAHFDVQVTAVDTQSEARHELQQRAYDLVLVNRLFDLDHAPGLEFIRELRADAQLARVPVMLVSDLAVAQDNAVQLGAVRGFGKSQLRQSGTATLLEPYLKPSNSHTHSS